MESIWNANIPWNPHGIEIFHGFHMDSIWNGGLSRFGKYISFILQTQLITEMVGGQRCENKIILIYSNTTVLYIIQGTWGRGEEQQRGGMRGRVGVLPLVCLSTFPGHRRGQGRQGRGYLPAFSRCGHWRGRFHGVRVRVRVSARCRCGHERGVLTRFVGGCFRPPSAFALRLLSVAVAERDAVGGGGC